MMKVLIRMTFAVALVLILSATGLWAAGADEEAPAAAADKKLRDRPRHRQGVLRARVWRDIDHGAENHSQAW